MRTISLTQNKVATVDDEDYEYLCAWNWCASWSGKNFYAFTGYAPYYMHKFLVHAPYVDHRDGDGLNNCRHNLRACTNSVNRQNTGPHKGRKYKGVYWHTIGNKWYAQIRKDGKSYHLGMFKDDKDAARAYDEAALRMYGPEATTNASLGLI